MTKLAIGIDIGGTNTQIGLVTQEGEILNQTTLPTSKYPNVNEFVGAVKTEIELLVSNVGTKPVGIGIGAPNGNFYSGSIEFAPNLLWKGIIPLAKLFEDALNLPVLLTNDANAAAVGEMKFGAAKGLKDFLFFTLGTGVGSGIVVNGEIVYGHDGFAGEIGHTIIHQNGRACGCGRKGCLEMYASVRGICYTIKELVQEKNYNSIVNIEMPFTSKDIYLAAEKGDNAAIEAFKITGDILGLAFANSVNYTSPSHIFVFGGLAHAWKFLYPPLKKSFAKNLLKIYQNKVKIMPSELKDADAAILGGAALMF